MAIGFRFVYLNWSHHSPEMRPDNDEACPKSACMNFFNSSANCRDEINCFTWVHKIWSINTPLSQASPTPQSLSPHFSQIHFPNRANRTFESIVVCILRFVALPLPPILDGRCWLNEGLLVDVVALHIYGQGLERRNVLVRDVSLTGWRRRRREWPSWRLGSREHTLSESVIVQT